MNHAGFHFCICRTPTSTVVEPSRKRAYVASSRARSLADTDGRIASIASTKCRIVTVTGGRAPAVTAAPAEGGTAARLRSNTAAGDDVAGSDAALPTTAPPLVTG